MKNKELSTLKVITHLKITQAARQLATSNHKIQREFFNHFFDELIKCSGTNHLYMHQLSAISEGLANVSKDAMIYMGESHE